MTKTITRLAVVLAVASGCAFTHKALPQASERVAMRLQEPPPSAVQHVVDSPSSVRLQTELGTTDVDEAKVRAAVQSLLEEWDRVPLTDVSRPFLECYVGLRAEGFDGGDVYVFQLFEGDRPSEMVLLVRKDTGAVLLLNYYWDTHQP